MILRATLRMKYGEDFVRTIEVLSALDFAKVERAAAAWAKQQIRRMPLYGPPSHRELTLHMEWVESPGSTNGLPAAKSAPAKRRKKARK